MKALFPEANFSTMCFWNKFCFLYLLFAGWAAQVPPQECDQHEQAEAPAQAHPTTLQEVRGARRP